MKNLGEFIPNYERIPREAMCIQWVAETNTGDVIAFIGRHEMTGALFRPGQMIVRDKDGYIVSTLYDGDWVLEGVDRVLRFHQNSTHESKYWPLALVTPTDKLPSIKRRMLSDPKCTKRTIMREFGVTQHVIKRWVDAGDLVFQRPETNKNFNQLK